MVTNDIKMGIWNCNSSNDHYKYNSKILTGTSPPPPYVKWMWKVVAKKWSPIEVWLSTPWKDPRETQKEDSHPKWVNVKYLIFRIWGIKTVPGFGFLGCTFLSFLNSELVWGQKKSNHHIHLFNTSSMMILGLQPRDKAAMLGVKTKEYFLQEFYENRF